jgi:hypothetical protein
MLQENRTLIVAPSLAEGENKTFKRDFFHVHDIIKTKVGISAGLNIGASFFN